jgi:hypothetical protein
MAAAVNATAAADGMSSLIQAPSFALSQQNDAK